MGHYTIRNLYRKLTFLISFLEQETAEGHRGAAVHGEGIREGAGLRSRALLPRAGEGRRAAGPKGPEGERLRQLGETPRFPPAPLPGRAAGLRE